MENKSILILSILGLVLLTSGCMSTTDNPESSNDSTPSSDSEVNDLESRTHSIGDTFEVDNIEYQVSDYETRDAVGDNQFNRVQADGEFIIVEIDLTNTGQESRQITDTHLKLVDSQDRSYSVDSDTIVSVEDSLTFEQLDPGLSKSGTLVYDAPADQEGRQLEVSPAGTFSTGDPHYVDLE